MSPGKRSEPLLEAVHQRAGGQKFGAQRCGDSFDVVVFDALPAIGQKRVLPAIDGESAAKRRRRVSSRSRHFRRKLAAAAPASRGRPVAPDSYRWNIGNLL